MTTHTKNQNSGHRFSERIARPRVLLLLAILAIGSLMLSFYLGTRYAATGPDPAVQAKTVIPVWAKVEERTVSEGLAIAGTTKAGETAPISARTNGEPVLVYQNQKPGNVLKAGDFIGIIGADPVFVLEGPLPLYRDLNLGDNGDDVLAFQKALNSAGYATAQSGTVTEDTLDAVTRLHRAHLTGVPSEGVTSIARNNYAILPGGSHTVTAVAAVGQLISDGIPIASVETSEPYVESSVELAVANKLKVGDRVSLRTSTGSVEGTITSIGELQNDPSKGAAKSVRFSADDPSKLTPGQSASITSKGNTSTTLAVPTTAVRQDSQGTYVLVEKGGSSTSTSKDAPATERV
ncbi:MAG: hypothetical protein ACOH1A_05970, partial [Rothia mucilaginosa]